VLRLQPRTFRLVRAGLIGAVLIVALAHASGVWPLRVIDRLQLALDDARLRATLPGTRDERIVIVDIDERSLAEIGRWPWGRDRIAALADELFVRQKVAVVGFDIVFSEPDANEGLALLERLAAGDPALRPTLEALRGELDRDARLARALAGRPAVLGHYLSNAPGAVQVGRLPASPFGAASAVDLSGAGATRWHTYAASIDVLARAAPAGGFFNALPDGDGQVRAMPLVAEVAGQGTETLALAMLRRQLGETALELVRDGAGPASAVAVVQDGHRLAIPVDSRLTVRIPYRGAPGPDGGSFAYVSAADLLKGRVAAGRLEGRLVLIGSTAPGVYDLRSTPVAQVYPGVEVHASLLSGLLDGRTVVEPDWARGYEIVQLLLVAALLLLMLPRLGPVAAISTTLGTAAALVGIDGWFYRVHRLALPIATALLLTAAVFAIVTSWGYVVEGRRRRTLARLFGSYVPPELVSQMARDPQPHDMRAENRVLSVMFCDMRNFTSVSEALPPQELRALINRFFSVMTLAIRDQRGTLDKYIGDAIMAFWGAPLNDEAHAQRAVAAALDMVARMAPLNAELGARGLPGIGLGIGINTGLVCVGDMGSQVRRSYTVMGDAVNLASRIEALTRLYGVDILVGESTREAAGDACAWLEVDRVRVKGKARAVTLFTPVAPATAALPRFAEEVRLWQLALTSWRQQDGREARRALDTLMAEFETSPYLGLYRQLADRVAQAARQPMPVGWDGTTSFDSK
jgi:adenylate cyclase